MPWRSTGNWSKPRHGTINKMETLEQVIRNNESYDTIWNAIHDCRVAITIDPTTFSLARMRKLRELVLYYNYTQLVDVDDCASKVIAEVEELYVWFVEYRKKFLSFNQRKEEFKDYVLKPYTTAIAKCKEYINSSLEEVISTLSNIDFVSALEWVETNHDFCHMFYSWHHNARYERLWQKYVEVNRRWTKLGVMCHKFPSIYQIFHAENIKYQYLSERIMSM